MEKGLENFFSGLNIGFLLSFLGGIVSFFSPCILPLVPAYFSFLLGSSLDINNHRRKNLYLSILFLCLGFTIVFVIMGASATGIGRFLVMHLKYFRIFAGVVMLIFGLETLRLTHIFSIHRGFSPEFKKNPTGPKALLFGAALGLAWTPCVGPVLGAILTLASTQETITKGMIMLFLYSLGLSIPFFIFALFFSALRKIQSFMLKHAEKVRIFAGIILVIFAFYLISRG